MKATRNSEKGQILVLLVLALLGLLAFTALAIDGGMIYSDRRYAQSVSDSSSMSGTTAAAKYLEITRNGSGGYVVDYTNFVCPFDSSGNVYTPTTQHATVLDAMQAAGNAAVARAAANNFIIDSANIVFHDGDLQDVKDLPLLQDNMVYVSCRDGNGAGHLLDKYIEVRTMVTNQTQTSFIHLFNSAPMRNTVDTITRMEPRYPATMGFNIVSLSQVCGQNTGGMTYNGDVLVTLGGGFWSNSCLERLGNAVVDMTNGTPSDPSDDGSGVYDTTYRDAGTAGWIEPDPQETNEDFPVFPININNCGSFMGDVNNYPGAPLQPGTYNSIRLTANNSDDVLEFAPGLYCIDVDPAHPNQGGEVIINGGKIRGEGVTFYIPNGEFAIGGGVEVALTAAEEGSATGGAIPGLLIYMPAFNPDNQAQITLSGTPCSTIAGLVYAPEHNISFVGNTYTVDPGIPGCTVDLANQEIELGVGIIGYDVTVSGSAKITLVEDSDRTFWISSQMNRQK